MPQNTRSAEEANGIPVGATFNLLYDEGYAIADAYDVSFTPEKKQYRSTVKDILDNLPR